MPVFMPMAAPTVRIGDAERDNACSLLASHFAAGRLTQDEYEERSAKAVTARTNTDLRLLLIDLPTDMQALERVAARPLTPASGLRSALLWTAGGFLAVSAIAWTTLLVMISLVTLSPDVSLMMLAVAFGATVGTAGTMVAAQRWRASSRRRALRRRNDL